MVRRFAVASLALALLSLPIPSAHADDGAGPVVTSYSFSSPIVRENETLYLHYNATDNDSIAYVQFDFAMNNSTIVSFNAAYDPALPSGNYTVWHDFTWSGLTPGRYDLTQIVTRDGAGNQRVMQPGELRYAPSFWLKGPESTEKPDLQVTIVGISTHVAYEGEAVEVNAVVRNNGTADGSGFEAYGYLDGSWVASRWIESLGAGDSVNFTFYVWPSGGVHQVTVHADVHGNVDESDERNNDASWYFYVQPVPPIVDFAVQIRDIAHEPLRTDAGNAPNPAARHIITLSVDNPSNQTHGGCVDLFARSSTRVVALQTSAFIGSACGGFGPGATVLEYVWDPLAVGDVTIEARLYVEDARDRWYGNNEDSHDDFVVVGGLGGVVLDLP